VSADAIRCRACGHANDATAFACAGCGGSLVSGADRWIEAREREAILSDDADRAHARSAAIRRALIVAVALVVLAVGAAAFWSWYTKNYYPLADPVYANEPPAYWAGMLKSDDHFLRRRAALALDTIADRFNERTAREIVPALKAALADPDVEVRRLARSALDKIAAATGVVA
jgi:hypothetical protein